MDSKIVVVTIGKGEDLITIKDFDLSAGEADMLIDAIKSGETITFHISNKEKGSIKFKGACYDNKAD